MQSRWCLYGCDFKLGHRQECAAACFRQQGLISFPGLVVILPPLDCILLPDVSAPLHLPFNVYNGSFTLIVGTLDVL
jgi:hypothetical protein